MHIITFFTHNLIWTEGASVLVILIVLSFIGMQWWRPLWYLSCFMILFSFYFFRNPERVCSISGDAKTILICPADGTIVDVKHDPHNGLDGYAYKVSIYLSLFDAHVNWIPMDGEIKSIEYVPGTFTFAFLSKSSLLNEHNDTVIVGENGITIKVRQIAGTLARRIRWWIHKGQMVRAGQKFGMIRFGSRVDIFMPESVEVLIGMGQRVYGGCTMLAKVAD